MKEIFKPVTDESPVMIIIGILAFYGLVSGFIIYLYILHRISLTSTIISALAFSAIYFPRLLIIKKLQIKDEIKILDDSILINGYAVPFSEIKDFRAEDKKPQVVFFMNNKMVVFQETTFHLRLTNSHISFTAIGSEKIRLLKEFLQNLIII